MGLAKPQGPDWWQASDGTWYPPQAHPRWQNAPSVLARTAPSESSAPSDWPDVQYGYVPPRAGSTQVPSNSVSGRRTSAWQTAAADAHLRRRKRQLIAAGFVVVLIVVALLLILL
jgi:hypothetical protein